MAWNSLKNAKKLSSCSAVGGTATMSLASNTLTICPMKYWYGNSDLSCFIITDKGALRILQPGTYLMSAGAYVSSNAPAASLDIAYTTTLDGTSLTRWYEARYQNAGGFGGGITLPAKAIRITAPTDVYLRVQCVGNTGTLEPTNNSTFLSAVRLNCIDEVK
jgi:hypothetical protein